MTDDQLEALAKQLAQMLNGVESSYSINPASALALVTEVQKHRAFMKSLSSVGWTNEKAHHMPTPILGKIPYFMAPVERNQWCDLEVFVCRTPVPPETD